MKEVVAHFDAKELLVKRPEELDAAEGMTAAWMHTWFTAIADVGPAAADVAADAALAGVMQRAAGVGGMPTVDPTVGGQGLRRGVFLGKRVTLSRVGINATLVPTCD